MAINQNHTFDDLDGIKCAIVEKNASFNPTNAIYGRLLRTRTGKVVTMAYWQQKDTESHDQIPYFAKTWR